jgi:phospholipase/carboxylesterase
VTLREQVRPAAGAPAGVLALLHGRGADEHDLFGLLDHLDPEARLVGVTPRAPLTLPPGGAHWYVVPRVGYPDPATFSASYDALGAWLDDLPERLGALGQPVVVGGFSQGAVMALALGLGAGRPTPGGVLALSGFVPVVPGFAVDTERPDLRVLIEHGTQDPVISVEFGRAARDLLSGTPIQLDYREFRGGHHVDRFSLHRLREWVAAVT